MCCRSHGTGRFEGPTLRATTSIKQLPVTTERDEVVAELRPCRRQTPVPDRLDALLDALAAAGEITRAAQPKADWTWRSRGLGLPSGTTQALLDDLR